MERSRSGVGAREGDGEWLRITKNLNLKYLVKDVAGIDWLRIPKEWDWNVWWKEWRGLVKKKLFGKNSGEN